MATEVERIAVLELKVETLSEEVHAMSAKLDELLELKAKGVGAIGLISLLLGSGIIGITMMLVNWMKG